MPSFPLDTGEDVRDKIDWEGGICGALDWGLTADDLPLPYRDAWKQIADLYARLDELCTEFYAQLPGGHEALGPIEAASVVSRSGPAAYPAP